MTLQLFLCVSCDVTARTWKRGLSIDPQIEVINRITPLTAEWPAHMSTTLVNSNE